MRPQHGLAPLRPVRLDLQGTDGSRPAIPRASLKRIGNVSKRIVQKKLQKQLQSPANSCAACRHCPACMYLTPSCFDAQALPPLHPRGGASTTLRPVCPPGGAIPEHTLDLPRWGTRLGFPCHRRRRQPGAGPSHLLFSRAREHLFLSHSERPWCGRIELTVDRRL